MSNFTEPAAQGAPRLDGPLSTTVQQPRLLQQPEERRPFDKQLKLCSAVATEVLILEIDPKPGTRAPVVHEDLARFRIIRRYLQHQKDSWKLNPANHLRMLYFAVQAAVRTLQQPGDSTIKAPVLRSDRKNGGTAHQPKRHGKCSFQGKVGLVVSRTRSL